MPVTVHSPVPVPAPVLRVLSLAIPLGLGACADGVATDADAGPQGVEHGEHEHGEHEHGEHEHEEPTYVPEESQGGDGGVDGGSPGELDAGVAYDWGLPEGLPLPVVPEDNPMSEGKVELGRHLFYDVRLSANGTQACGSCHEQALGFAQPTTVATGSTGELGSRNSIALANVAYLSSYTWVNPVLLTLERQIAVPLFGDRPVELGVTDQEVVLARLRVDPMYQGLFEEAYPGEDDPIDFNRIVDALACFLRSLVSLDSPYDRFQRGDRDALSASAQRGLNLFFGERLECHHCHNSFMFTNAVWTSKSAFRDFAFFNTGLYNVGGAGTYPEDSVGLFEFTDDPEDHGKFRTPSLRNVAVTAPYLHDGSAETLEEVVRIYERGGRNVAQGPLAGDGRDNPNKSGLVPGFELTDQERADLIAFLESLTDETFLTDPRFADPFEE